MSFCFFFLSPPLPLASLPLLFDEPDLASSPSPALAFLSDTSSPLCLKSEHRVP